MKLCKPLIASLMGVSMLSCAHLTTMGDITVEIPKGWYVKHDDSGWTASPNPDHSLPLLSIDSCERKNPACSTPCDAEKVRANYFYFSAGEGKYTFSQRVRHDGVAEFGVLGTMPDGDGEIQIASSVICSTRGIVYLGLLSKIPLTQLPSLQSIAATVRWLP